MNAYEMFREITEHKSCEGIDDWLKATLLPRMRDSSSMTVNINTRMVVWPRARFIRDMEDLGYTISLECEDRPCAEPYYRISLRIIIPCG